jgi:hypothetical protein
MRRQPSGLISWSQFFEVGTLALRVGMQPQLYSDFNHSPRLRGPAPSLQFNGDTSPKTRSETMNNQTSNLGDGELDIVIGGFKFCESTPAGGGAGLYPDGADCGGNGGDGIRAFYFAATGEQLR